jgi:hypothetical protein
MGPLPRWMEPWLTPASWTGCLHPLTIGSNADDRDRLHDWSAHVQVIDVLGGQGTLNVNSWAPDSDRFAYVSYPLSSSV